MKTNFTHTMLTWIGAAIISTACAWGVTHYYSLQPTTDTPDNTQPDYVRPAVNTPRMADTDFTTAAQLSVNAVVHVKTTYTAKKQSSVIDPFLEFFFGLPHYQERPQPQQQGFGSGVIISNDGYIVTNNHVIDRADMIQVVLNDKRTYTAQLVGTDPTTDIALLKIEADSLPTITFGDSDMLKVGEWVLAVGNPFNLTSTVTAGIVSAKARNINILNAAMKIESFIQTDAAVNPGNSGGALVNTQGRLVGINTAIASETGSYAGYAFAVPTSIVQKVVEDLKQHGTVQRAILGVQIADITDRLAKDRNIHTLAGAYVNSVMELSAAHMAGITEGDIITHVNNSPIKTVAELQEQIGRHRPGDEITITLLRNNTSITLPVTLQNRQGTTEILTKDNPTQH
ncbi:MAG: trypsin-like peptidase domain-containing protein [Paludibacteraceae bacterium]|nr:trypsin-like peptidase domain-containing protein [Paludibacteraceae bacterium]